MWERDREHFLEEVLRHNARSTHSNQDTCIQCGTPGPTIRCHDCFTDRLICDKCTVHAHNRLPFHRLERWTDSHFKHVSLKELGLRLQLGHPDGEACANPHPGSEEFVVIHTNGIHNVRINFCACQTAEQHTTQLLRARLFPATVDSPKTAATFAVLEHFHLSNFESKASAWHYYSALARLTDNTGLIDVKVRYEAFRCMVREWRHIRILKRAGRGHNPLPLSATPLGACAVECPACPHPGVNLPLDWEDAPPDKQWLYTLILAMDANFRLKRRKSSSNAIDPGLGTGLAYFVEDIEFRSHIAKYVDQPEICSCSGFSAVHDANTRCSKGLSSTGVGALVCARHQLVRRTSACDLQKGEKYANMDYIFWSAVKDDRPRRVVISYDIACQWMVNLWSRVPQLPPQLQSEAALIELIKKLPNFHRPAHKDECQTTMNLHYTKGVGTTDGEAIEREWAGTNPLANSTKEMGPGARHDTLDDHWGDMNWKKVIGLGISLMRKMKLAVPGRCQHEAEYNHLSDNIEADTRAVWTAMIEVWDVDQRKENPYAMKTQTLTQANVRLAFARDEATQMSNGVTFLHEMTPTVVICKGLDLEDQQRRLRADVVEAGPNGTSLQMTKLIERRNVLRQRIESWIECYVVYMPCVTHLRLKAARLVSAPEEPETTKLWLPSAISPSLRGDGSVAHLEWTLRFAQGQDALVELRHCLRLRSYLYKYKDKNIRGQRQNTRAQALISRADRKIKAAADKYLEVRSALVSLGSGPKGAAGWELTLKVLKPGDVRQMTEGLPGESEGKRTHSWIWLADGVTRSANPEDDPSLQECVRVEWAKVRARALRYAEEVDLVQEEMRRTLQWLLVQSELWIARSMPAMVYGRDVSPVARHGLIAYAHRQAAMYQELGVKFAKMWESVPQYVTLGRDEEQLDEPGSAGVDAAAPPFMDTPELANFATD
ncbi:hypothetical protein BD410DRAFT_731572 [Rickenella mellea]|uniref:CxC2-like cysteine cluster KDZ transposase-associated domain-containing protein n=1 Tax=Rickenella mellea TaxID=50990 RepID=A0A4Y7PLC2_9AGAM|nr:hypothetical protein BD410DRAFT_731572 [Rickenella mellea]